MSTETVYFAEDLAVELPDEIEKYKQYGDFTAAQDAIARWLERLETNRDECQPAMAEPMKKRLLMEKRILEGLRVNYPYTEDEAIALMREKVPDFGREDLVRLDQEGLAEWIFVDGQKHYIHNFVRNVTKEDPEIVRRIAGKNVEEPKNGPAGSGSMEEQKRDLSEAEFFQAGKADGTAMGDSSQVRKSERWMYPMNAPVETAWREALRSERDRMCEEGVSQWRFRLRTSIRLKDEWFYPGIHLRAHLPIPAELYQTSEVKILAHSGGTVHIDRPDSLYRSICLEDTLEQNREFFVEYEYTVTMKYHDLSAIKLPSGFSDADVTGERFHFDEERMKEEWEGAAVTCREKAAPSTKEKAAYLDDALEDFTPYLREEYPHIRFTPYLRALAQEITATSPCGQDRQKGEDVSAQAESGTALAKAWAIYDYITKNVRYSFMREYYLIPDIPQYCARNLRGDCGVQAMLFITLCRICGIPAKWQSGLYLAGETVETPPPFGRRQNAPSIERNATHLDGAVGLHDWAMFYAEPYGWLYADLSFGGSAWRDELRSDSKEMEEKAEARRRFYFGNLDPFRMAANNAFGQAFAVPKRFFPADPYDNQQGELESDERGFGSRDVETKKTLVMAERLNQEKALCADQSGDSEQVSDYAWLVPYAEGLLEEAAKCNPGPWVAHSRNVAKAARKIAEKCIVDLTLDPDRAYISGLLHDIGRRFGVSQLAHVYDGYHYLMALGFPEFARIALTHSFNLGHLEDYIGKFDISEEKQQELRQLLDEIEFDDYDYLIQYCDSIATTDGIVSMEDRMNDVKKRYGYYPQEKWARNLELHN